jgi:hypothetical protein
MNRISSYLRSCAQSTQLLSLPRRWFQSNESASARRVPSDAGPPTSSTSSSSWLALLPSAPSPAPQRASRRARFHRLGLFSILCQSLLLPLLWGRFRRPSDPSVVSGEGPCDRYVQKWYTSAEYLTQGLLDFLVDSRSLRH